jgi:hypothetical protein
MQANMNAECEYKNMNAELRECRGILKKVVPSAAGSPAKIHSP